MERSGRSSLKQILPSFLWTPARSVYHAFYPAILKAQCAYLDWKTRGQELDPPLPPAMLRFRVGESLDAAEFLHVGRETARLLCQTWAELGVELAPDLNVLDFGCGCARTLRWLVKEHPQVHWTGCDVDAEAIDWCRQHLPGYRFEVNPPMPPAPFPDASFDVLYGISVFTHLDETAQRAWLPEFHRLLRPGGMALLSFHSESVWRGREDAARIAAGEFVFERSRKLRGVLPDWYHTAFQSRARIETLLLETFGEVRYFEGRLGAHDLAVGIRTRD